MKKAVPNKKLDFCVYCQQHQASSSLLVFSNDLVWLFERVFGGWHNDFINHTIVAGSVVNELILINSMPSEIDEWQKLSLNDVFLVNNIKHHQDYSFSSMILFEFLQVCLVVGTTTSPITRLRHEVVQIIPTS